MKPTGFTLLAGAPGSFTVRVHYTPYWHIASGGGSIAEAPDGWTRITADRPGTITVAARL
jgi:hypothetical protein